MDGNPVTKEELEEVLNRAMERHMNSPSHRFVETLIQREQRKQELWSRAKGSVVSWGIIAVLTFVGMSLWYHFKSLL